MSIRDTSGQDAPVGNKTLANKRRRNWLLIGAAGLGLVLAIGWVMASWSSGSSSVDASKVRIAEVTRGDLVRDISADGRVIAANNPTLYAIAGGTVTLNVVAGDAVKQNDVLAEIDSPELRSQFAQEQATLASLEAEAGRAALDARIARSAARQAMDQAEIERQAAQRDLERNERAFAGGAVAQIDVARAQDNLKKAEIGMAHARQTYALEGQGAGLDGRNKRLLADRQRAVVDEVQRQVEALKVRAPFNGMVGQVLVDQRANVADNAPLLSVVDLTKFEVQIKVPESFARDLGIGMPAQIGSNNQRYSAEVSAVSPEVVNGEVTARLRFADGQQPPGLRQNQRLSARIVLDTRRDVLQVERGPFLEQDGGRFAYVVDDGSASRRPIQAGASSLGAVEIISGLQAGDRVVVSGSDQFDNAEQIRISGD